MPRKPRELKPNSCYHVTVRFNNREFKLIRHECREVFLYALKQARATFSLTKWHWGMGQVER
jgi:putative transposase